MGLFACDVFDTGDGGVELRRGDRKRSAPPAGHFAENCHFQRQGRSSKCYVPSGSHRKESACARRTT